MLPVIEVIEVSARRHGRPVLDGISFQVRPGQVTGLLGLPGAGKTAVLRRMLQLDPGGGRTLYDGRTFRMLRHPMRTVGVMLDPLALNPGRTVTGHLRLALSADPGAAADGRRERIAAVLDVCGLGDQAKLRISELTEGMTVRLALAQALLGDPEVLLLDEPEFGLEPEGLPWLDALLRAYAAQGRCVLVTGQNTDSMVLRADRILVLDEGRLVGQRTARQAARDLSGDCVIVRTPQVLRFAAVLVAAGAEPTQLDGACLEVRGLDRARVGDLAFRNEIPLHELAVRSAAEDPVVAVLEACRRPPSVLPVQAPATVQVPEHAEATVVMPFSGRGEASKAGGTERVERVGRTERSGGKADRADVEVDSAAESALLSVIEVPRAASEAAPRSSTEAAPRSGTERTPRSGTDVTPRSGTDVAPRSGIEVTPRSGSEAVPQSASDVAPRLGIDAAPRSGTDAPTELMSVTELKQMLEPENDGTVTASGQESVR